MGTLRYCKDSKHSETADIFRALNINIYLKQKRVLYWTRGKTKEFTKKKNKLMCLYTSNGVKGHFPSTRFAPGLITLPLLLNFPLQLLSRAISISCFSSSPPSYSQHENATMSFERGKLALRKDLGHGYKWRVQKSYMIKECRDKNNTSSKRRCTETYLPPLWELFLTIRSTMFSASFLIGPENLSAS